MVNSIKIADLINGGKAHSQTGPFGTQLKASEYIDEGVPVINVRNIGLGEIRSSSLEFISEEKAAGLKSHCLEVNDIVFGRKGAVERHSIITPKENGWIQGSDCIRLRFLTKEFNPQFVSYFFRTIGHQQWMINLGSFGATMGSLNQEIISKIQIPNISRFLQDQIASILSAYDDLIENNNQRIQLLEEMAQEIYKEWFVRLRFPATGGNPGYREATFLDKEGNRVPHGTPGALPEGWSKVRLKEVAQYINRGVSPIYVEENGVKVINQKCIRNHKVNLDYCRLSHPDKKIQNEKYVQPFDVLVNSTGTGTLGRVAQIFFTDTPTTVDTHVTIVRAKEGVSKMFLGRALEYYEETIKNLGKGSTNQIELSRSDLADSVSLVLPPKKILDLYDSFSLLYDLSNNLATKNKLLKQTRDLLLPRLISGKLNVENLNWEESESLSTAVKPEESYSKS